MFRADPALSPLRWDLALSSACQALSADTFTSTQLPPRGAGRRRPGACVPGCGFLRVNLRLIFFLLLVCRCPTCVCVYVGVCVRVFVFRFEGLWCEEGAMAFGVLCLGSARHRLRESRLRAEARVARAASRHPALRPEATAQGSAGGSLVASLPCATPIFRGLGLHVKPKLAVCNFLLSPDAYCFLPLCPLSVSLRFALGENAEKAALESRIWLSTEHLILPP